MKKVLVFLLGFFIFSHIAVARYMMVYDVDKSNYPTILAKILAIDDDSEQFTNISKSNFKIYENGVEKTVLDISCPTKKEPEIISSVLVMDESGSMSGTNNAMAKTAAKLWINSMANAQSECAIVSFSKNNRLIQDFTTDRTLLLSKTNDIDFGGSTNYNAALIEKPAGGLLISDRAKYKPAIVFLSDGASNTTLESDLIINEAKRQGVAIHVVTIAMPCPADMKNVAEQTGGLWFEYISTETEMNNAYQIILQVAQSLEPCSVEWETDGCDFSRACTAEIITADMGCSFSYAYSSTELAHLEINPNSSIKFGEIEPNTTATKTITITARVEPITINDIVGNNAKFKVLDYGGSKPPFTLGVNQSRDLHIEFAPVDSMYHVCKFKINSNSCLLSVFYCTGGFWGHFYDNGIKLKLTHPNGGEEFLGGSDTLITWEGCAPDDSLDIEFSSDAGTSWETIITDATNFSAAWKNLPSINSDNCLIRATMQREDSGNVIYNPRNIKTLRGAKSYIYSLSWCENEKQIVSGGILPDSEGKPIYGEVKVWEVETEQEELHVFDEDNTVYDVAWSPNGKWIAVATAENVKVYDVTNDNIIFTAPVNSWAVAWHPYKNLIAVHGENNSIDVWDVETGQKVLATWSEHANGLETEIIWSPDGERIVMANIMRDIRVFDINTGEVLLDIDGSNPDYSFNCNYLSMNIDGSQISYVMPYKDGINIYDSQDGTLLNKIVADRFDCYAQKWSPDGKLIAYGGKNKCIYLWDTERQIVIDTLIGHQGALLSLEWSKTGQYLASSSADSTIKIWQMSENAKFSDVSDAVFSIVMPEMATKEIDMGDVFVETTKDSVITKFLQNPGQYKNQIDSVYISGGDVDQFACITNNFPIEIEPGQQKAVEFRFKPTSMGAKQAEITVLSYAGTDKQKIYGNGIQNQLESINEIIDFGVVSVGDKKDTIQALTIKNISNTAVNIKDIKIGTQNNSLFSIINNISPLLLNPGETCKMDLRFNPSDAGRVSGTLEFSYDGFGSPAIIQLFGEGFSYDIDSLRLHAANVSAYDDRIIHIPIILDSMEKVKLSGVTAISADLQYNSTLLYPNYKYERSAISPTIGQITLSDLPIDQAEGDTLTTIMFKTGLGNAEGCDLVLLNPVLTGGGTPEVITEDGYFSLLGVCHEGGARLFSDSKIASGIHAIRPNPASNYVSIDIGIIEKGYTEVAIYDVLGKKIKTVFAEEIGNLSELGERTVSADLSEIANGQYMLLFKSPTYVEQKAVMVWK